jgi:hypothetical protein
MTIVAILTVYLFGSLELLYLLLPSHLILILLHQALLVLRNVLATCFFIITGLLVLFIIKEGETSCTFLLFHHLYKSLAAEIINVEGLRGQLRDGAV